MLPDFLHKYFGFNKQQGRGLFVLVLACILMFLIRLLLPFFEPEREILIQNLPLLELKHKLEDSSNSQIQKTKYQTRNFPFDPNKVSFEQLLDLGFKPSSAKAMVKFREKGFIFRTREDLLKVYGVDQVLFERIREYILLPEKQIQVNKNSEKIDTHVSVQSREKVQMRVELNSADSLALLPIPGIGPSFSKRILKYRDLLGGFYQKEQLMEVYGFTEEMFHQISPFISINPDLIRKLNLNTSDFKSINRHPYLSYEQTKSIVNARNKQKLDSVGFKTLLQDEALFRQLRPYCTWE